MTSLPRAATLQESPAPDPDLERPGLLISIQPRYATAILAGHKTVELRRRPPKSHPPVVVIYGSGSEGSVVGTARLRAIHTATPDEIWAQFGGVAGVNRDEFDNYFAGSDEASALEFTAVQPAIERLPLSDLRSLGLEPPQSWRYVDGVQLCALVTALYPVTPSTDVESEHAHEGWETPHRSRALWPLGKVLRGIQPVASFGLRCFGLGLPARTSHPAGHETVRHNHHQRNADAPTTLPWTAAAVGLDC